jgi:hypothetical protein
MRKSREIEFSPGKNFQLDIKLIMVTHLRLSAVVVMVREVVVA